MENSKICIVGLGYMGLPTALLLAKSGFRVVGFDIDEKKIEALNQGYLPFEEEGLMELYREVKSNFSSISNLTSIELDDVSVYILCLPTPFTESKTCDLNYIESALINLIPFLKNDDLIILEATVSPGTTKEFIAQMLAKSGKIPGENIDLAYVSEKAIPGNTIYEMVNNDRIIGGYTKRASERTKRIYLNFVKGDIYLTDTTTAEAIKVVENTFRDINIAFANELVRICDSLKINVWEVIELANKHPRVNILSPGPGVGGHCIAIDPWFLHEKFPSDLISVSRGINDSMPAYVLSKIKVLIQKEKIMNPIIGILGVAYKKNVDDCRDTPAEHLISAIKKEGWEIKIHDPFVRNFSYPLEKDVNALMQNCNLLVLITDHDFYKGINFKTTPILDTRNMNLNTSRLYRIGTNEQV